MNLRRLGAIVLKELRQLRRDRLTFAMIVGIPIMQLVLFGYAINMDVRGLHAAVLDQANTARSREVVAEFGASQVLDYRYRLATPQQLDKLLREGSISAEAFDRWLVQDVVFVTDLLTFQARLLARVPRQAQGGIRCRRRRCGLKGFRRPGAQAAANSRCRDQRDGFARIAKQPARNAARKDEGSMEHPHQRAVAHLLSLAGGRVRTA